MAARRPVIAGNWKMYKTTKEAVAFTEALAAKVSALPKDSLPQVVLCPPYTALSTVRETIKRLHAPFLLAAQNMESHDEGAYTGEISPIMLKDLDVNPVVIGHSERRQYYGETDEAVNAKVLAALRHQILPIICVGETLEKREQGQTDPVIERQVEKAIEKVDPSQYEHLIFAYEPVWAIGTGKVCEAAEANRVCALIRSILNRTGSGEKTRILYGGSVKPDNTHGLMSQSDIDGALVGGASLEAESFYRIIEQTCLVNA